MKISNLKDTFTFKIYLIKNGFAGPKSFGDFRETGPWACDAIFNCLYLKNKGVNRHKTLL